MPIVLCPILSEPPSNPPEKAEAGREDDAMRHVRTRLGGHRRFTVPHSYDERPVATSPWSNDKHNSSHLHTVTVGATLGAASWRRRTNMASGRCAVCVGPNCGNQSEARQTCREGGSRGSGGYEMGGAPAEALAQTESANGRAGRTATETSCLYSEMEIFAIRATLPRSRLGQPPVRTRLVFAFGLPIRCLPST